jgi:hypothetical protein
MLKRPYRLDVHLEVELVSALDALDAARAVEVADAAAERADAAGDEAGAALARTVAANARLHTGQCSADELERLARVALPLLEALGDDDGLAHVWQALGWVANMHSRLEGWADAIEQALCMPAAPDTPFLVRGHSQCRSQWAPSRPARRWRSSMTSSVTSRTRPTSC